MSLQGFNQEEVSILNVELGDPAWIIITFVEPGGLSARVRHIHTLHIDPNLVGVDYADVLSTLRDMVQMAQIEERHPPDSFIGRRAP